MVSVCINQPSTYISVYVFIIQNIFYHSNMYYSTTNTMEYLMSRFDRYVRLVFNKLNTFVNKLSTLMLQMIDYYMPQIKDLHALIERFVAWMDEAVRTLNNHPMVKGYYKLLDQMRSGEFMMSLRQLK